MSKISVFNCETQTEELRDMTEQEIESLRITQESIAEAKKAEANKLAARQAAYLKLGLTSDEVEALFK